MLALEAPRWPLAIGLAVAPAVALFLAALLDADLLALVTSEARVRETYARFISGLITAATIAVGFASLALRRGIKGIGELRRHVDADKEFSESVRRLTGRHPPSPVGEVLVLTLREPAARADRVQGDADAVRFARALSAHAREVAANVSAARSPDAVLRASLDLDVERAIHAAELHGLREVEEALDVADLARSYLRTLATQWTISRMSQGIALSSFIAACVAAISALAYGTPDDPLVALTLVTMILAIVLLPLAVFVSFVLRTVFLHRHTVALGQFVLGPENEALVADQR